MSRNWPSPAPELRAVFPPLVWRRKQRVVVDLAAAYLSGRVPRSVTGDFASGRTTRELPDSGIWPELHIAVPELRLSGRVPPSVVPRWETLLRLDRVKLKGCGLSPTGLRTKLGSRFVAGLVALSTSLKSWFQSGLELWKEMPMRKALEFGLRVVVFETLYAIGASYTSGVLTG